MKYYCVDFLLDTELLERLMSDSNPSLQKEHLRYMSWMENPVLEPTLFSLYITPIEDLMRSLGIDYHLYADDTQLYITFKSADPNKIKG
jgi:hypothetical protein